MPEGILLVQVQAARDADDGYGMLHLDVAVEQQMLLPGIDVLSLSLFRTFIGKYLFAAVARVVAVAVCEAVGRDETLVFTSVAVQRTGGVGGAAQHFVERGVSRSILAGIECAPDGAHQLRIVAAEHLSADEFLKGTHHGVILHGSSLHHDVRSQFLGALQTEHLVQAVLHDRVGQSGCNVPEPGSLTECLFHLGVHEHRAAGAQVVGAGGMTGFDRKVLYRESQ